MKIFWNSLPRSIQLLFVLNIIIICGFSILVLNQGNMEFLLYMAVILIAFALLTYTYKRVDYPPYLLWLLSLWGLLHLAGGLLYARGDVWYNLILIDIIPTLQILKYDQAVHIYGFFTATLLIYYILRPHLTSPHIGFAVGLSIVAAGSGFGAWNEIVEFIAQATVEGANVGGYLNTSLDTISNLVGGIGALIFLKSLEYQKRL